MIIDHQARWRKAVFALKAAKPYALIGSMLLIGLLSACAGNRAKITVPPVAAEPTGTYHFGKFVWADLLTDEVAVTKNFYGELFGWRFQSGTGVDSSYTTILHDDRPIGGIVYVENLKKKNVDFSQWMSYLSVRDADAAVKYFKRMGGKVLRKPFDLHGRGRVAVVADPQGALLALVHANGGDPADTEVAKMEWLWHELYANDIDQAVSFYEGLVGYKTDVPESAQNVPYYVFKMDSVARAGVLEIPWKKQVKPNWLPYILVDNVKDVVERTKVLGGEIILAPDKEVRNGSLAIIADPSGAAVALQKWPY